VVAIAERYGKWPGVVAIVGDADMYCIPCAKQRYGEVPIQVVIAGERGYEQYTDHSRNPLGVVLYGSEDVHGMYCGGRGTPLCDEDCICYQPDQAEYWNQYGTFFDKLEGEVEDE
jgi:hypothetical protein